MDDLVPVRRALLSVYDKTGVVEFARALAEMKVELLSSGGTAKLLRDGGLAVRDVADVTGFPEMMDGRVKTLHPKIHGAILGLRDNAEHRRAAEAHGIGWIDLVAVNLYPFKQVVARGASLDEALENIDIGGPAMVRASSKNYPWVAIVTSPDDYAAVLDELRRSGGKTSLETRRGLALKAFATTSDYDAAVAAYLNREGFPPVLSVAYRKRQDLRYGENPHQKAALYEEPGGPVLSVVHSKVHGGVELSYNNILDLDAALGLVMDLPTPGAVVVKHGNPCGAASAPKLVDAFVRARDGDPLSAYGGIVALNAPVDAKTAEAIAAKENFFEAIIAPGYDPRALETLRGKKKLRILELPPAPSPKGRVRVRGIAGGILAQTDDDVLYEKFESATVPLPPALKDDVVFAWIVCKHAKSNTITIAKDRMLVGIGAGNVSRVDAAAEAVRRAGDRAKGGSAASDAFFPFPDGVEKLIAAGVAAIIQPGGSIRDAESIALAQKHNVPMILTGTRHFRH